MSPAAKVYILVTLTAGYAILGWALLHWQTADLARFLGYLAAAMLAAVLRIQLPGISGMLSVQFVFLLLCAATLSRPEAVFIACLSTPLHWVVWSRRQTRTLAIAWSVASSALAVTASYATYHGFARGQAGSPMLMVTAATVFFFVSTILEALPCGRRRGWPHNYDRWAQRPGDAAANSAGVVLDVPRLSAVPR
jgi:hypothetical protein